HHHHHQRIPNIDIECVNVPRQKVFPLFGAQLRFLFNFGFDDYIVTDLNCLEHYTNIIFYHLDTIPFCNRIFAQRKSSKSIQAGLHKIIFCRTDSSTVNPSVRNSRIVSIR
ncbi:hypothetical protein SSS_10506, partial [Sarcoptes scabiei]